MYVHVFWHIFKAIKLTKCPSEFHKQHSDDDGEMMTKKKRPARKLRHSSQIHVAVIPSNDTLIKGL